MDEPTASLDLGNRILVLEKVRALATEGFLFLMSTHEPEQAFAIADRVAVLEHENRFAIGTSDDLLTPELLGRLYGLGLIETTPSGRRVVGSPNNPGNARPARQ